MKDAQGELVHGRTRWRRFAVVVIPAVAAAGAIVFGMANGAIAASFSVSGQSFKVKADRLEGEGFVQYGGLATPKGVDPDRPDPRDPRNKPAAVSGIRSAKLFNLCQSVKVPDLPVSMVIRAGREANRPATAENLLIKMSDLKGDATFTNINIGQDASTLTGGPPGAVGQEGAFGQQSQSIVITNLRQVAYSTSAGTFTLNGLHLYVSVDPRRGPEECFPDER